MLNIKTQQELVGFFNMWKGQTRANIVTRTPVKLKKTGNPYGEVFKVQTSVVDLNVSYAERVNDQRMLEGDLSRTFEAGQRQWGESVNGAIIEKDGKFYLNAIEVSKIGNAVYELSNGDRIDYEQIAPFMSAYSGAKKQGLENEVKVRSYKLDNVIGLNIDNKVRYIAA